MKREIKHSVWMITYNQENTLERAIESILKQTILPYEIVISDDCSSDKTPDIIQRYMTQYPGLIKGFFNPKNLGIRGNRNHALSQTSGDILSGLAGDDFFYDEEMFEKMNQKVIHEGIDLEREKFVLVTNTMHLYPTGRESIFNNYQLKGRDLFKEQIRGGLSLRTIGYSKNLRPYLYSDEKSIFAGDGLVNTHTVTHVERFYFVDTISSVYVVGIGVTANFKVWSDINDQIQINERMFQEFKSRLDFKDRLFLRYKRTLFQYYQKQNPVRWGRALAMYILNSRNFSPNNSFRKNIKNHLPFKSILYKIRKKIYGY